MSVPVKVLTALVYSSNGNDIIHAAEGQTLVMSEATAASFEARDMVEILDGESFEPTANKAEAEPAPEKKATKPKAKK